MNDELIKCIMYLLAGVATLLIGMKLMSSGLKKCIGKPIRNFFRKTENNPVVSMGIGTVVTAGIQSSDATNAMVIGFINAGAMTIYQGMCIMLGAYIGTTVTGVLASFSSLSISTFFLLFAFIGVIMMFFKKDVIKNIGEILCGLGLLFFGIAVMKDAFVNEDIKSFCTMIFSKINIGPVLFLIGVILTALLQSSSAFTSIVIAIAGTGAIELGPSLYLVLGATLGTVTNTLLTSLNGNVNGKRAALLAFCLRAITSIVMMIILIFAEKPICNFMLIFKVGKSVELPIALFTVFYNVIFMPLLLPFLKPSIKFMSKIVKDKEKDSLQKCIHFIDDKLLVSPQIAGMQVKKEIINMYDLSCKNYIYGMNKLIEDEIIHDQEMIDNENSIDYLNNRITNFLIELSNKVQRDEERAIGTYFHVINDIERIGDHAYNFYEMYKEMNDKDLKFSDVAKKEIKAFDDLLHQMFNVAKEVFLEKDANKLKALHELESKTDELKTKYTTNHFNRIKNKDCSGELSPYFSSLMAELERIADHLNNIGYSIVNPTGDDEEKLQTTSIA